MANLSAVLNQIDADEERGLISHEEADRRRSLAHVQASWDSEQ